MRASYILRVLGGTLSWQLVLSALGDASGSLSGVPLLPWIRPEGLSGMMGRVGVRPSGKK